MIHDIFVVVTADFRTFVLNEDTGALDAWLVTITSHVLIRGTCVTVKFHIAKQKSCHVYKGTNGGIREILLHIQL